MINKYLKAKHWQLFSLIVGIPFVMQIVFIVLMISNIAKSPEANPIIMFDYMMFFPLIIIVFMGILFSWFWSLAIGLQNKIPKTIKMKTKQFRLFFFIPLIYMGLFSVFMVLMFSKISLGGFPMEPYFIGPAIAVIFPLHLFSMFCIFHTIYFTAKTIKTVDLQKEVSFGEFIGEFFMLWFYPIGIWFIQSKVNKMVSVDEKETILDS